MMPDPYQQFSPAPRKTPYSDLDYNLMLTDPVTGSDNINEDLQGMLEKSFYLTDKDGTILRDDNGQPLLNRDSMWRKLNYYTRDMRLGNLSTKDYEYCRWYLDFAGYCIQEGYVESFVIALQHVITILELSQSKGGFLRKQPNTLRTENVSGEMEPPKKQIFNGGKRQ